MSLRRNTAKKTQYQHNNTIRIMKKIIEYPTITESEIYGRVNCNYHFKTVFELLVEALKLGETAITWWVDRADVNVNLEEQLDDREDLIWERGLTNYTYNNPRYFTYELESGRYISLLEMYEHIDKELFRVVCEKLKKEGIIESLVDNTAAEVVLDASFYHFTHSSIGISLNLIDKMEIYDGKRENESQNSLSYFIESINKTLVITSCYSFEDKARTVVVY